MSQDATIFTKRDKTVKNKSIFEIMNFVGGVDEDGRYWEIDTKVRTVLREKDMVSIADWIATELGWIGPHAKIKGEDKK
jgi:hypothetical protein